jgi:hypothetical protein
MAIDGMMEGEGVLDIRLHRQGQGVGCGFSEAPDISDLDETMAIDGMMEVTACSTTGCTGRDRASAACASAMRWWSPRTAATC